MISKAHAHPEWKRLYEELRSRVEAGQLWTYEELKELAGIDIRTSRGRQQFHRFAKEVLDALDLHFECERTKGYRVVKPNEQATYSLARVRRGQRQVKQAFRIVTHIRLDQMTPTERTLNANVAAHTGRILQQLSSEGRLLRKEERQLKRGERPPRLLLSTTEESKG
jgi:hypothetical protein